MKKTLALTLTGVLLCGALSTLGACTKEVQVPTFEKGEGIKFASYAGLTIENWNLNQKNVNTLTDEHFQKFVDAGFTTILALWEGAPGGRAQVGKDVYETIYNQSKVAEEHAMQVLALAEKYGVKYYVRDWPFYDMSGYWAENDGSVNTPEEYRKVIERMFDESNPYLESYAYAGNMGMDEPGAVKFERLKWQAEIYNEVMKERGVEGEMFVNLLPCYGNEAQFGGEGADPISYTEYVNQYFEMLAPELGYVSYDYYPFLKDSRTGSLLRSSYISNLEIMANKCKETNTELRTFVCTGADFTGLRSLTSVGDFRFQVYCNLAFGSHFMSYYEYGKFKTKENCGDEFGLINLQDGTYNYTYDMAKMVNNEVHAMEDALTHFKYDGIMCFSGLQTGEININFRGVANQLTKRDGTIAHPRIASVSVTEDAIMSSMKDADGNDAFMLVNYTDPYYDLDNTVTVKFNDATHLLMYRFGKKHVVPLSKDGSYTFELYPGEGRFIIPLK